jgi:tetratricopeptide (TPR) repeat protein
MSSVCKDKGRTGRLPVILALLTAFGCLFAPLFATAAQDQQGEITFPGSGNIVNIDFVTDIRVFTVMAALNVAGFDSETPGREMSPTRRSLRQELTKLDPLLLSQLRGFYAERKGELSDHDQQVAYTSFALVLSGPPDFRLSVKEEDLPEDALRLAGFEKLLRDFYAAAEIPSLWQRYQPQYQAELNAYRPVVRDVMRQTLDYFRIPPRIVLDRKIVIIPDLLNVRDIVNARNLTDVYFVVLGPAEDPRRNWIQLQHEYLHFLVDPILDKFAPALHPHERLLDLAQHQPLISSDYQNDFLMVARESLIESLILRLNPPADADRAIAELFRRGLVLVPHFHRGLLSYEQEDFLSFPSHLETLLQSISSPRVLQDAQEVAKHEEIQRARLAEQRESQRRLYEQQMQREKIQSRLAEARRRMNEQDFAGAEGVLEEILDEDPGNPFVLFDLAQVSSQQGQLEEAFGYYKRAAEAPSANATVRAWSLLRMGNISAFQEEYEEARHCYQQVLQMEGDLDGARDEAEKALRVLQQQD